MSDTISTSLRKEPTFVRWATAEGVSMLGSAVANQAQGRNLDRDHPSSTTNWRQGDWPMPAHLRPGDEGALTDQQSGGAHRHRPGVSCGPGVP